MKNDLTASYVRELFDYDTKTGNLIWKVTKCNRAISGSVAGGIYSDGYRTISIDSSNYRAHRLVWLHHYGEWPEEYLQQAKTLELRVLVWATSELELYAARS